MISKIGGQYGPLIRAINQKIVTNMHKITSNRENIQKNQKSIENNQETIENNQETIRTNDKGITDVEEVSPTVISSRDFQYFLFGLN